MLISIPLLLALCACTKPLGHYPTVYSLDEKSLSPDIVIRDKLYNFYAQWQGTPYKTGGLSKRGMDCSGFVYISFRNLFNKSMPRTTLEQRKLGTEVSQRELQSGDLLFFKTGWFTHHVGIYLENMRFAHASTSQGVMISSLKEEFWRKNFYIAKRIELQ